MSLPTTANGGAKFPQKVPAEYHRHALRSVGIEIPLGTDPIGNRLEWRVLESSECCDEECSYTSNLWFLRVRKSPDLHHPSPHAAFAASAARHPIRTSGPPEVVRKKSPRHQVPARNSDVVVWHATHGLAPGAGTVTGVCANCKIEKTTLRIKAA